MVVVVTCHPGMPATSIEKTITNRIERWCNQASGAQVVTSRSLAGVSIVRVFFRKDIEAEAALTMVNQLALGTLPTLPPNTLPPIVLPRDPLSSDPLGVLTVSNPDMNEADLKDIGRIWVRNVLRGAGLRGADGRRRQGPHHPHRPQARRDAKCPCSPPPTCVAAIKKSSMMVTPGIAYFGDNQMLRDSNLDGRRARRADGLAHPHEPGNDVFLRDIGDRPRPLRRADRAISYRRPSRRGRARLSPGGAPSKTSREHHPRVAVDTG